MTRSSITITSLSKVRIFRAILLVMILLPFFTMAQPTFADLSVLLAKGYFKSHVPAEASLEECVAFLNHQGVYISIFDLMDQSVVVTKEDFARMVSQSTLLFLGEAEIENDRIKRPHGIDTWIDYCQLNDVNLQTLWTGFVQRTKNGSVPEVKTFFNKSMVGSNE